MRQQHRVGVLVCSVTWAGPVTSAEVIWSNWRELRAFEGRIDDAADAEHNVVWRQLAAVLEPYVCAQIEHDCFVVGVAPAGRYLRHDLAANVAGDKVVEDVAVDSIAVGVPLQMRVHRRDIARHIDGQRFLRLRPCRHGHGHEKQQHEVAHHCLQPMSIRKNASFGIGWNRTSLRAANIITSWYSGTAGSSVCSVCRT